jgi:nitroreductase
MAGFLNSYYGVYNSFGVDKYGNPVDNPLDAEYLIVPGTKELGLNDGKGIMVNTRAMNFIANFAGPAYAIPLAVGSIVSYKPEASTMVREAIDKTFGKIPGYSYEDLFPYGINPDLGDAAIRTFTPAWARNAIQWISGDIGDKEWLDTYASEWNYQMALYEMGIGKEPTEKLVAKQTSKKFREKFLWQFASPLGSPAVIDMRPDSIFSTYYRAAYEKYKAANMSDEDASKAALNDLNERAGVLGATQPFNKDRLYFGAKLKPKATYVVPTVEGYSRVWEDNAGLAKKLGEFDKNLIGLMTADLIGSESDPNISRILNKPGTRLPDGTTLNLPLKSIKDVENDIEVSKVWDAYVSYKDLLNKLAKEKKYASYASVPELREALQEYAKELSAYSPAWGRVYKNRVSQDSSYKYAWGLTQILNDKKFMEQHGNSQFWVHAKAMMKYRDDYAKLYKDAPSGAKSAVQNAWTDYVESVIDLLDPNLADIFDRYFLNDKLTEVGNE